jgi:tRNA C32,U32 (ribose-2'-O)-methylase TrmJ
MISTARKTYSNPPIFLAMGSILIRVLGRWDIRSFQSSETHLVFMELLSDMKRYFDQCNREKQQYADRQVGKLPRRMKAVISRFQLSSEDVNRLNDVLKALKTGEELGLIPI